MYCLYVVFSHAQVPCSKWAVDPLEHLREERRINTTAKHQGDWLGDTCQGLFELTLDLTPKNVCAKLEGVSTGKVNIGGDGLQSLLGNTKFVTKGQTEYTMKNGARAMACSKAQNFSHAEHVQWCLPACSAVGQ